MRNNLLATVLPAILLSAWSSTSLAQCPQGTVQLTNAFMKTAEQLRSLSSAELNGYIMGFANGIFSSPMSGNNNADCLNKIYTCVKNRSETQLAAILRKYLDENPKVWNYPSSSVTYIALLQPCE